MTNPKALAPLLKIQLEARSRKAWNTGTVKDEELRSHLSWAFAHLSKSIGKPLDDGLSIVSLANWCPKCEQDRSCIGVGHTSEVSKETAIANALRVLALCFELSMQGDQALSDFVEAEYELRNMRKPKQRRSR